MIIELNQNSVGISSEVGGFISGKGKIGDFNLGQRVGPT